MSTQVMKVCQDVTFRGTETKKVKRGGDEWGSYEKPVSIDDTVCAKADISSSDAAIEALLAKADLDKKLSDCNYHSKINECTYAARNPAVYTIETRTSIFEDAGSVLKRVFFALAEASANSRVRN